MTPSTSSAVCLAIAAFCAGVWITRLSVRDSLQRLQNSVGDLNARIDKLTSEVAALRQPHFEASQSPPSIPQDAAVTTEKLLQNDASEPSQERGYTPIKHLVVTASGEQWVTERLPKNDDRVSDSAPPSVCSLISKPLGYRLLAGYHMLQEDDPADSPAEYRLIDGYHLLQEDELADTSDAPTSNVKSTASNPKP